MFSIKSVDSERAVHTSMRIILDKFVHYIIRMFIRRVKKWCIVLNYGATLLTAQGKNAIFMCYLSVETDIQPFQFPQWKAFVHIICIIYPRRVSYLSVNAQCIDIEICHTVIVLGGANNGNFKQINHLFEQYFTVNLL